MTAQTSSPLNQTRQLLADPAMTESTPGSEFAQAAALGNGDEDVTVTFRAYLPTAFPLFAERPRYTVRQLMKMATIRDGAVNFVYEPQPDEQQGKASGTTFDTTPESAFKPTLGQAPLTDIGVTLPVPPGLLDHPRLLASFIDFRLLVRFGTTENQVLLRGSDDGAVPGLLELPDARRVEVDRKPVEVLTEAAALVEETGGSCDGIVAHTAVYWEAVQSGLLGRLAEAGVRISRTRMIPRHQVLLGDFRAATTFLDPGVAYLKLHRGGAPDGGDLLEANSRMGLAVHLPQHFVLLEQKGGGS
ncbi:family 3 encapsulin nanocompartment shell protein [Saccharothrix sp. Mg75]|uniref:family 3 encapsulin nanocompartment shell protein n=1 Tax=Saccharothrix sp. Mg75 TaxID=3445357 RepID=UPI003EE9053E